MYQISDQQIDYILDDIRARGVEMESLQQNLVDHICCIIEQELEANGNFETFYHQTIHRFYKDELWEIEEETISLLTFKHYYTMKKVMIVSGTISAAAMSVGIFFKFMHWPGASALLVLGIGLLSFLFLPLLFTLKAREKTATRDKIIVGLGSLSAILLSLGILFKVMHWPGANMMGVALVCIMLLLFLPIYFFTGIRNPDKKVNTIVSSILMIMGCGLFLTLVNSRPSIQIHAAQWSYEQVDRTYHYAADENNKRYEKLIADSSSRKADLQALHSLCESLYHKIDNLKLTVVNATEDAAYTQIDFKKLGGLDNYDIPTFMMFDLNTSPKNSSQTPKNNLIEIRKDLEALNALAAAKFGQESQRLIDLSKREDIRYAEPVSWEVATLFQTPMGHVIENLTQLEIDICLVEANCLH